MRKVIFMILLAAMSGSAMADWTAAKGNAHVTFYYDSSSIVTNGITARLWILQDFKKAAKSDDGRNYLSVKAIIEFSCREKQLRGLYVAGFSKKMGKGKVVFEDNYDTPETKDVPPGSLWESVYNAVCSKK